MCQVVGKHLHPAGLKCPRCGETEKRIAQRNGYWTAYRFKACDRYYSLLTQTVFEKTRQPPSKVVLILRGTAKGEPTARLSRELAMGRPRLHKLRKRIQQQLAASRPTTPMTDRVLEADELASRWKSSTPMNGKVMREWKSRSASAMRRSDMDKPARASASGRETMMAMA